MDEGKLHLLPHQTQNFNQKDFDSLEDVSDGGLEDVKIWPVSKKVRKASRWLMILLPMIVFIIALGGLVLYIRNGRPQALSTEEPQWKHCGNTSAEARANDCILDFIPGAWVPRACYDAELEKEFLGLQNWQWYADKESQHELSLESIRETGGPNPLFVSMEYHRQHCGYTWRKLHRAVIRDVPIDTHIGGYRHTVHCSDALASPDLPMRSKFFEIFASCKMPQDCKSYKVLGFKKVH
jgi:hypothetical protein